MTHLRLVFWVLCCAPLLLLPVARLEAADAVQMEIWPSGAPGLAADAKREIVVVQDERIGRRVTKVTAPQLTVYRPAADVDTGAAVVVCPGGGYNILAVQHEGIDVAQWLNGIGITGIVLQYRVPRSESVPFQTPPLQDVQRTLRLARHHAQDWGINPRQIGVMGFSAGGNLAALAATNFGRSTYEPTDEADSQSARPDFAMLIYPAYLTREDQPTTLQENVPVSEESPPAFLVHTGDDRISVDNSIAFYRALRQHGVPAELHVYARGGHGYGLRSSEYAVSTWPDRAARWLDGVLNVER